MSNDATVFNSHHYDPNLRLHKHAHKNTLTIKRSDLTRDVEFRIVCHFSIIKGLFEGSEAVIPTIRRETNCRIHCAEKIPGSDHRVVSIIGSGSIDRRIVFCENDVKEEYGDVSSAQEAVIRVFERVWEVEAEMERESTGRSTDELAYCGLLANTTQIGAVVGKKGKNVMRMREKSGAKIRMLPSPACAGNDDELIQILGNTLAVKKALVAITACLQSFPPIKNDPASLNEPVEVNHRYELSLQCSGTGSSTTSTSNLQLPSKDDDKDTKSTQHEVVFRMLCSNKAAGGIIGKRGIIVKDLEKASGAFITFATPLIGSGERVVTISALENFDTCYSPAQNAVILVFTRSIEVDGQRQLSSSLSKDDTVTVRLLVGSDLVSCLTSNEGQVISEMIDLTGAVIQILREQIVDSVAENEVVVQITGKQINVQNALYQVTGRLRQNILNKKVLNGRGVMSCNGRILETRPHRLYQSGVISPTFEQDTHTTLVDKFSPSTISQPQMEGRGDTTTTTYGELGIRNYGGSLEFKKSLDYLPPTKVRNEIEAKRLSRVEETTSSPMHKLSGQPIDSGQQNILSEGMTRVGLTRNISDSSKLHSSKTNGGGDAMPITDAENDSTDKGLELQSGNKSIYVARTTLEIVVAKRVFGYVYGNNGGNLARLKQISGAKVEVQNPGPSKNEGMVIISGTPDQTLIAQSLLQAFVLVDH